MPKDIPHLPPPSPAWPGRCRPGLALLAAAAIPLAACAPRYHVAAGAPAAKVRLLTSTDDNTTFTVLDPARCPETPHVVILAGTGQQLAALGPPQKLDIGGDSPEPPAHTRERWLAAGKRLYIAAVSASSQDGTKYRCAAGVSFVPLAGAEYQLRYWREADAKACSILVTRLGTPARPDAPAEADPTQRAFRALKPAYLCDSL